MSKHRKRTTRLKLPKIPKGWENDLQLLPQVEVWWEDATTLMGWRTWDDIKTYSLVEMKTVGRLLPSTKKLVRVAPSVSSNGNLSDAWLIPRAWVKSVRRLKG